MSVLCCCKLRGWVLDGSWRFQAGTDIRLSWNLTATLTPALAPVGPGSTQTAPSQEAPTSSSGDLMLQQTLSPGLLATPSPGTPRLGGALSHRPCPHHLGTHVFSRRKHSGRNHQEPRWATRHLPVTSGQPVVSLSPGHASGGAGMRPPPPRRINGTVPGPLSWPVAHSEHLRDVSQGLA